MIFKVAILQKRAVNGQTETNAAQVEQALAEAGRSGSDILLLPECFLTGYDLPMTSDRSLDPEGEIIEKICAAAKKHQVGVVLTSFTKGTAQPRNSAIVISKDGERLMQYDKVHTCDFADEKNIESGTEFKVCDFHGVRLGVMICYDREYPESARVLMLKGAEIILVPNDCASMAPRVRALSTRAYENMVGVAMANPNGPNAGCSCAFSPICWDENGKCVDNTILLADEQTEGMLHAEFDIGSIRDYRSREMMGNTFRKARAYGDLVDGRIGEPFIRDGQQQGPARNGNEDAGDRTEKECAATLSEPGSGSLLAADQ